MKRNILILLIVASILIVFSTLIFASEPIDVKEYIKGKLPLIFNIYLASLEELDEYEKEFIDLLQKLPEDEQIIFAKEVKNDGFSKEILEKIKKEGIVVKPKIDIVEKNKESTKKEKGKWVFSRKTDPIDDSTITAFILYSDSGKSVFGEPIRLVLRHQSGKKKGKTCFYINWYDYLGGDSIFVKYRLGTGKAKNGYWAISTDNTATFYSTGFLNVPSSKHSIEFIRELMAVDRFVAQVTPYNENPITAVFDVRGLKNAVENFNNTLHWIKD
jgi:type VI secretion system protein VasI